MDKKAGFFCATFRRPELLEQSIGCFLAQDWDGEKVMIVINDEPEQKLTCDHPEVLIFNRRERLPLAAKWNVAIGECLEQKADYLFHADDDDLFAPWRISCSVRNMRGGAFKTDRFYIDTDPMQMVCGRNPGNYAMTPRVCMRYGGYHSSADVPFADLALMDHIDFYMQYNNLQCEPPTVPFMVYRKNIPGVTNYSSVDVKNTHIDIREAGPCERTGLIEIIPVMPDQDYWSKLPVGIPPVPIHTVDSTYSEVDLSVFYKGIKGE